jgi:hypothetical protein
VGGGTSFAENGAAWLRGMQGNVGPSATGADDGGGEKKTRFVIEAFTYNFDRQS